MSSFFPLFTTAPSPSPPDKGFAHIGQKWVSSPSPLSRPHIKARGVTTRHYLPFLFTIVLFPLHSRSPSLDIQHVHVNALLPRCCTPIAMDILLHLPHDTPACIALGHLSLSQARTLASLPWALLVASFLTILFPPIPCLTLKHLILSSYAAHTLRP